MFKYAFGLFQEEEDIAINVARKNLKAKLWAYKEMRGLPSKKFKPRSTHTVPPLSTPMLPTTPAPVHVPCPQPSRTIKKAGRRLKQPTLLELVKRARAPERGPTQSPPSLPHVDL